MARINVSVSVLDYSLPVYKLESARGLLSMKVCLGLHSLHEKRHSTQCAGCIGITSFCAVEA